MYHLFDQTAILPYISAPMIRLCEAKDLRSKGQVDTSGPHCQVRKNLGGKVSGVRKMGPNEGMTKLSVASAGQLSGLQHSVIYLSVSSCMHLEKLTTSR
jgi:hypothetical protein